MRSSPEKKQDANRKMSVDAYYSSEIGIKDLRYQGNGAYSEYTVPKEALDFVKPLL